MREEPRILVHIHLEEGGCFSSSPELGRILLFAKSAHCRLPQCVFLLRTLMGIVVREELEMMGGSTPSFTVGGFIFLLPRTRLKGLMIPSFLFLFAIYSRNTCCIIQVQILSRPTLALFQLFLFLCFSYLGCLQLCMLVFNSLTVHRRSSNNLFCQIVPIFRHSFVNVMWRIMNLAYASQS